MNEIESTKYRVNALNSGSVLNIGNRPLYTMMSHFAAIHPIIKALNSGSVLNTGDRLL